MLGPAAFGTWALLRLGMPIPDCGPGGLPWGRDGAATGCARVRRPARLRRLPTALGFILVTGAASPWCLRSRIIVQNSYYRLLLIGFSAASVASCCTGPTLWCAPGSQHLGVMHLGDDYRGPHVVCAVSFAELWVWAALWGLALANSLNRRRVALGGSASEPGDGATPPTYANRPSVALTAVWPFS